MSNLEGDSMTQGISVAGRHKAVLDDAKLPRLDWDDILQHAASVVRSYETSVTLRQLFYRLVSEQLIPNTTSAYKVLSKRTAEARRDGWFPDLIDRGRAIHRPTAWASPDQILTVAQHSYRRDRTEGQDVSIYVGVEKAGTVIQLESWFGERGVPILALGGYSSQSYIEQIKKDVSEQERPAVLLYAGDFDPSGEDIDRDFVERTGCWQEVVRVALTREQVEEHKLPVNAGKAADSRSTGFVKRHGELVQVELDALPPETLHDLYEQVLARYWDDDAFKRAMKREASERAILSKVVASTRRGRGGR